MNDNGLINCPNCNKRTFTNNKQCIYCKYILNNEHNFNNEIYNFLYKKYDENKNKMETIKIGMTQYNLTMEESKKIVDHISELMYFNNITEKNKKDNVHKEELPTNGIDYSKYINHSYKSHKKRRILKTFLIIFFISILFPLFEKNVISGKLTIILFVLSIILLIKTFKNHTVPSNPHTFIFSFSKFLIHYILPRTIVLIISLPLFFILGIRFLNNEQKILFSGIIIFIIFLILITNLRKNTSHEFTVDYENIIYKRRVYERYRERLGSDYIAFVEEWYNIHSIKEIKETMNSIIIYGDIRKKYYESEGSFKKFTSEQKIDKLQIIKCFKKNRNLIKSLKIIFNTYK